MHHANVHHVGSSWRKRTIYNLQLPVRLQPATFQLMACQSAYLLDYWGPLRTFWALDTPPLKAESNKERQCRTY